MKRSTRLLVAVAVLAGAGYAWWKLAIPRNRVEVRSELVMLGDLDGDHRWTPKDLDALATFLERPFAAPAALAWKVDLNRNGRLDAEDRHLLEALVAAKGDPYAALDAARGRGEAFPRPRELYRFVSADEYLVRPRWALPVPPGRAPELAWLPAEPPPPGDDGTQHQLDQALYDEGVRLDQAQRLRAPTLLPAEREYAQAKLEKARALLEGGERFEALLALMDLVEDAETLSLKDQPELPVKLLLFRNHLRELQASPHFAELKAGKRSPQELLKEVSAALKEDLGLDYDLETLGPPRDFTHLENYLQRSEWQYYKSSAREADFRALIAYAQHDPRYLKAVARTSKRLRDPEVANHNLPMVLLFREALRLTGGDKKRAVGLLDEAIRVPFSWVKALPKDVLPGSLALDNFLLPGNKEDGADKSRHWNVFGGICLYKSPQEALDLALRRELQDLKDASYSPDAMRELFRDLIADLNGMYQVMSVDPALLERLGPHPDAGTPR